jgi:hypothetical protein
MFTFYFANIEHCTLDVLGYASGRASDRKKKQIPSNMLFEWQHPQE